MGDETSGRGEGWVREVLFAFGRGLVKVLTSLLIGAGAGLLTFGLSTQDKADLWRQRDPPPELFLGIGVGLLTAGALMALLFMFSRLRQRRDAGPREPMTFKERG